MDDLSTLAPEDVFRLAILRSSYPVPVLVKRLKWSESFLRRVTSSEKYFPSFVDVPDFCAAVGNTLVIEWQLARVKAVRRETPDVTPDFLRDQVLALTDELGDVAGRIRAANADKVISKPENRGILKEVLELLNVAHCLAGALREADRRIARHG